MNRIQVKLSVIVPVYNAEKYIGKCIESLVNQTYKDFELIIVNDGSTDRSSEICEMFIDKFRTLSIIHKNNTGLISARIEGLRRASGYYISFVDADDWVEPDFLELLLSQMESAQADIVITGCIKEEKNKAQMIVNKFANGVYEREYLEKKLFPKMLHYQGFFEFGVLPYMWNKMYKKDKLIECYKSIDTDIYDGEDVAVVFPYLLQSYKVVIINEAKYHYRIHSASMTAYKKQDYYKNVAKLYLYLYEMFHLSAFTRCMLEQLDQYMRMMVWNGNPKCFIEADENVFPFEQVQKGSSVVLYAAGNVGRRYQSQIQRTGYCSLAAWVDKNWQVEELRRMGVESPDIITSITFDYVVVAIEKMEIAKQVRNELTDRGVQYSKIIIKESDGECE